MFNMVCAVPEGFFDFMMKHGGKDNPIDKQFASHCLPGGDRFKDETFLPEPFQDLKVFVFYVNFIDFIIMSSAALVAVTNAESKGEDINLCGLIRSSFTAMHERALEIFDLYEQKKGSTARIERNPPHINRLNFFENN